MSTRVIVGCCIVLLAAVASLLLSKASVSPDSTAQRTFRLQREMEMLRGSSQTLPLASTLVRMAQLDASAGRRVSAYSEFVDALDLYCGLHEEYGVGLVASELARLRRLHRMIDILEAEAQDSAFQQREEAQVYLHRLESLRQGDCATYLFRVGDLMDATFGFECHRLPRPGEIVYVVPEESLSGDPLAKRCQEAREVLPDNPYPGPGESIQLQR